MATKAIQNQMVTISMHIPSLMKIIDVFSSNHPETKYGETYNTRNTDFQHETIIPRDYRVAGYKIVNTPQPLYNTAVFTVQSKIHFS